jgi:O-antigen ligase/tetratricopeptide (TPR) repeat protein
VVTRESRLSTPSLAGRLSLAASDVFRAALPFLFTFWLVLVVVPGRPNLAGNDVYGATVQLHVLIAALFLTYAAYLALSRKLPDPTPLDWCAAGLLAAFALSTLFSVNPRVSFEASLQIGVCVAAFYVFHERGLFSVSTLIRGLVLVVGFAALLILVRMIGAYIEWAATVDSIRGLSTNDLLPPPVLRSTGVIDHPNILAMLLNLGLPFAIVMSLRPGAKWERAIGPAVIILTCFALFFTLSRGAWLALLVSQPMFWLFVYLTPGRRVSLSWTQSWVLEHKHAVYSAACLVLLLIVPAVVYVSAAQPAWLFRATLAPRLDTVSAALSIFVDHPLTGAGPLSFGLLNEAYGIDNPEGLTTAHNAYALVLADIGILGAIAILAGGYAGVRTVRAWKGNSRDARLVLAAASAAILATLVHGLVDSPPAWNTVLLPFTLVLALAVRGASPGADGQRLRVTLPRVVPLLVVAVVILGWLAFERGHSQYDASLRALGEGRLPAAAAAAVEAAQRDPDLFAYQLHAGVTLITLYVNEGAAAPAGALEEGIASLRRAVELDPRSSLGFANLALALRLSGDDVGSAEAARRAMAESPHDATIAIVAGSILETAGFADGAVEAYGRAVRLEPGLSQSPFWSSTAERLDMRDAVLDASRLDACAIGRYASIYRVYSGALESLATGCRVIVDTPGGESKRSSLALILFALGKLSEARLEGELAIQRSGSSADSRLMSAIVLSDGELIRTRVDLYQASQRADPDAAALLAYTYVETPPPAALNLPSLPRRTGELPALAATRLNRVAPAGATVPEEVRQMDRKARVYFTHVAQREAPAVVLIPGEWSELVSPAVLLALELQKGQ